jgi:flagellar protein FlaG
MSYEIGPISPVDRATAARRVLSTTPGFSLDLARTTAQPPTVIDATAAHVPASPPPDLRDAIGAAAARAAELRSQNRELHFEKDKTSGRVIIQVRDLAGNVIRTIPPSSALEIMSGAAI